MKSFGNFKFLVGKNGSHSEMRISGCDTKSSRFRDSSNKDKGKHHVNFVDEEADDEEGNEIYVSEWVENPGDKPISCSFLKPNGGQREEMRYTFDVSKCDHFFYQLLRGGVI
jgi:hypothetical protein